MFPVHFPIHGEPTKVYFIGEPMVKSYYFLWSDQQTSKCHPAIPEVNGAAGDDEDSAPHGQGRVGDPAAADSSCPMGIWSPHFWGVCSWKWGTRNGNGKAFWGHNLKTKPHGEPLRYVKIGILPRRSEISIFIQVVSHSGKL
jgi:hypothetical protein